MQVGELIEILKTFDPNLHVSVFDDGLIDDATTVEIFKEHYPEATDSVVIY